MADDLSGKLTWCFVTDVATDSIGWIEVVEAELAFVLLRVPCEFPCEFPYGLVEATEQARSMCVASSVGP